MTTKNQKLRPRMMVVSDVDEVVERIGIYTHRWIGQCSWITAACYHAGLVPKKSRVCYGSYFGYIHETSQFYGRPFSHHSWIELPDFTIYDPTRWVFTCQQPFIWRGPARDKAYDLGGSTLFKNRPAPKATGPALVKLTKLRAARLRRFFKSIPPDGPDRHQWWWLAHRHPDELGEDAKWIYQTLIKHKLAGIIPVDFTRYVFHINPEKSEARPKSDFRIGVR